MEYEYGKILYNHKNLTLLKFSYEIEFKKARVICWYDTEIVINSVYLKCQKILSKPVVSLPSDTVQRKDNNRENILMPVTMCIVLC